ncbi:hypothetical protein GGI02_000037 [Coemansia sp. RSA 2322]|nr:hypothetical protein GGI02_000037 [Coemansia sp. RSA 2322]
MGLSDELNKFIPKDFGKKKKANAVSATDSSNISVSHSTDRQQPAVAATLPEAEESVASKPLDNRAASDDAEPLKVTDIDEEYPVDSQIVMMEHNKAISAVAWDPSGDVLASGDHGSLVHLWDFGAMDGAYRSTRTLVPFEGQQVRDLRFNRAGTLLLCATSDPRAKLYDIDGRAVCEFKRGDMYVSDMRKTKGHVAGLFSVDWSPHHDDVFASASADGTISLLGTIYLSAGSAA